MSDPNQPTTGPSFEVRIRHVLSVLLGGLSVVAAGGVLSAWALDGAAGDVDVAERSRNALGGVMEGMVEQESGVRGFILTGQERFLETYGPGGAVADANRTVLGQLAGDLEPAVDLGGLDATIAAWRAIADEEIALVRSGRPEDALAIVESGAAKARFDAVRAEVRELDDRIARIIDARNQRQVDLERLLAILGIVVFAGALVIIVATLRWLRRSVTRPLALLAGAVDHPSDRPLTDLPGEAAGEVSAVARGAERLRVAMDVERNEAVLLAEQTERTRIAADLHDGPVQTLFAVQLRLQHLLGHHRDDADISGVLRDGIHVLETTQADLRALMFDLAPPGLGERSLADVLAATVPQVLDPPATATVDIADGVAPGLPARLVIHRVVVEALRNVNRHAGAASVEVRAETLGDHVAVEVIDDGAGFTMADERPTGHFGLSIMRSLVESVGGRLTVSSEPGSGTTVHFEVPM